MQKRLLEFENAKSFLQNNILQQLQRIKEYIEKIDFDEETLKQIDDLLFDIKKVISDKLRGGRDEDRNDRSHT